MFLLTNLVIVTALYLLVSTLKTKYFSEKLILIGVFFCAQIIFTELVLGILGVLYLHYLIFLNLFTSFLILIYSLRKGAGCLNFRHDFGLIKNNLRLVLAEGNWVLVILAFFVCAWIICAAYFLPPRGEDDLIYHLPVIYEYVLQHKICLLPVELKPHFAFPFNAELLFMWPVIFSHTQKWVDCIQLFLAILGIIAIYGLGRFLKYRVQDSFFLALLFFFTPVVLIQLGSNYIDIITNAFFLISLYFSLQFNREGRLLSLYAAAISMGLMVGMKYAMLLFFFSLQFIIFSKLFKQRARHFFFYVLIIFLLGGYWYLRNYLILGDPLYPIGIDQRIIHAFQGEKLNNITEIFSSFFIKCGLLFFKDVGMSTFNGGLGLTYWSIAFPVWIYILIISFKDFIKKNSTLFLLWIQPVIGFVLILSIPLIKEFQYSVRYVLFVTAIGFLAMGEILFLLRGQRIPYCIFKMTCILFCALTVTFLPIVRWPHYRIDSAIVDLARGENPSEFKYYKDGSGYFPSMRYVAEPLDYLTRDNPQGFNCYIAADWTSFWLGNIYGSRLQNRIWNFQHDSPRKPDVCVFQFFENKNFVYVGKKITLEDIVSDPSYRLIVTSASTLLFIDKNVLGQNNTKESLISYYQQTFPSMLKAAQLIKNSLKEHIPIVTSSIVGHGLQYLELTGSLTNPLYWVPEGQEESVIKKYNFREVYSLNKPLNNFSFEKIYSGDVDGKKMNLYKNTRMP